MRRLTSFASFSASAWRFAPQMTMPYVCEWRAMSSRATPNIWRASSLVGDITITPVPFQGLNRKELRPSTAGIKNDSVLPDLVFTAFRISRPASKGSIPRC